MEGQSVLVLLPKRAVVSRATRMSGRALSDLWNKR